MAIYNVGERYIGTVRVILASYGIFAANMADIDAMEIPDPEGHQRHIDDWKSNDGRRKYRAESHCPIWVFEDQAFYRNMIYGWTGQRSSSGLSGIAGPALGVFASLDRL
jgi:hypothetical protein